MKKADLLDKFIPVFFLMIIFCFSAVNFAELIKGAEPEGRRKGLEKLEYMQDTAINAWGALQKAMGKRVAFGSTVYEDVTLLDNGMATLADKYGDISAGIAGVSEAYDFASGMGAEFLYVGAPAKAYTDDDLPEGVISYANAKYFGMIDAVSERDIPYISMRDILDESGNDWYSYFSITDHHWRNSAAFMAFNAISGYMDSIGLDGGYDDEILNPGSYDKIIYDNVFLGTHGRMTGRFYTGLDDYELWIPMFDTDYTLDILSEDIHREGSFEDCFVNYENLDGYSFDYYAYYAYLGRDYDRIQITNNLNPDGPKVVIVKDSMAVPVTVFLAGRCSYIDMIDLRYLQGGDSAKEWIAEDEPDLIIYLFGTGYLGAESAMDLR